MDVIDYIAIIASILTIISVCINIIQWQSKKSLVSTLKSRSQASFNYFYQIAVHSDKIRFPKNPSMEHEIKGSSLPLTLARNLKKQ